MTLSGGKPWPAAGQPPACGPPPRPPRLGFTLVELLVTVAILALLIAILLPSLRSAKWQAQRVVCQSNLRQITTAGHSYLNDNNGAFYQGVNANVNWAGQQGAAAAYRKPKPLNPYLGLPPVVEGGADIFRCPSDRGSKSIRPTHFDHYGTSYNTNLMLVGQNQMNVHRLDPCRPVMVEINKLLPGVNQSRIANDSKLIFIGDFGWVNAWYFASTQRIEWHHRPDSHNVAYMDGHAEFLRIRKGLHVTADYLVVPFKNLVTPAQECQVEVQ